VIRTVKGQDRDCSRHCSDHVGLHLAGEGMSRPGKYSRDNEFFLPLGSETLMEFVGRLRSSLVGFVGGVLDYFM
jgi:hypothetical protein